jgi:hypothetical protein
MRWGLKSKAMCPNKRKLYWRTIVLNAVLSVVLAWKGYTYLSVSLSISILASALIDTATALATVLTGGSSFFFLASMPSVRCISFRAAARL